MISGCVSYPEINLIYAAFTYSGRQPPRIRCSGWLLCNFTLADLLRPRVIRSADDRYIDSCGSSMVNQNVSFPPPPPGGGEAGGSMVRVGCREVYFGF